MKILKDDVKKIFIDLINKKIDFSEAEILGEDLSRMDDLGLLVYVPRSDEKAIWEAILFFSGLDVRVSETQHLHSLVDVIAEFEMFKARCGNTNIDEE